MPPTSPTPVNRDEAPVRERGDACPGALRLHAADDGRLARIRLPAGLLTPPQAEVLAAAAERLGDGHLDLTSRGNIQLRGLAESCGGELARLLYDAGLLPSEAHERVRNVVASPLAGLDGSGEVSAVSVQLWARELDELLCASEPATALSGRFLFALDDGRGDVAALGADVTLLAQRYGTASLHIQANRSGWRVSATEAPRAALLAAETFLTVAAASGSGAWRVRELPVGHGLAAAVTTRLAEAGIAAEYGPASGPGHEPAHGPEDGPRPAHLRPTDRTPLRPTDRTPLRPTDPPDPGLVPSPDGTVAVSVHAPLGRLTVDQWRLLASPGTGDLRVTPWRGVIVPGLDAATAPELLERLRTAGLVTDPGSPWYGVGACTGRPGCAKALSDVRADAAGTLPPRGGGLPVYWSGCARRCGRPHGDGWVDVVARDEGVYDISTHGLSTHDMSTHDIPPHGAQATTTSGPAAVAGAVAAARTTTITR